MLRYLTAVMLLASGANAATFDHFTGTAAPSSWTVSGATLADGNGVNCMNGTIVGGAGGTCTGAVTGESFFNQVTAAAADAALAYRTIPVSPTVSAIYWFAYNNVTTGNSYIYLNEGVPAEGVVANVFGAAGKALLRVEAQTAGANIGISRWDTIRTRTQWNSATNVWGAAGVNATTTLPNTYQVIGLEIDGPNRRWRVHVVGQTGTSNTPSASLFLAALTDWTDFSFHEGGAIFCNPVCGTLYLAIGEPLTDSATGTTQFEWYAEDDGALIDGWHNGRNNGGTWNIYHYWAYPDANGIPTRFVPEDRTTTAVAVGGAGAWDELQAKDPYVIKDGATYYMVYGGARVSDSRFQVGCASATSASGPWTKCPGNPIVALSLATNEDQVANPVLVKDEAEPDSAKRWKLMYVGIDTSSPLKFRGFVRTCSAPPTAPACDTAGEWSASTMIWDAGGVGAIDETGCGRLIPHRFNATDYLFCGVRAQVAGVNQNRQETYGTSSTKWLSAIAKSGTITNPSATSSCNTTTTAVITTPGSRSFTVASTTGCTPDMFVVVDDDATSANYHHNRILNVVNSTTLTMYHNEDSLASGARVRGPQAFWQVDVGDVGVSAFGVYYKIATCFDPMIGGGSTFDAYSEKSCMWTAPSVVGPWTLYNFGSPAAPLNAYSRGASNENMGLVNLPFTASEGGGAVQRGLMWRLFD